MEVLVSVSLRYVMYTRVIHFLGEFEMTVYRKRILLRSKHCSYSAHIRGVDIRMSHSILSRINLESCVLALRISS